MGGVAQAACACILLFTPSLLLAWSASTTHRKITRESVRLLDKLEPSQYGELQSFNSSIEDGAQQEDERTFPGEVPGDLLRVVNHFYNPRTQLGFGYDIFLNPKIPPNASSWDLGAKEIWPAAVEEYRAGRKARAYRFLGRAAHLLTGDAAQPAHVHDDPHAPTFLGGDSSPTEDYGGTAQGLFYFTSDDLTQIEGGSYTTPDEFILNLAELAYSVTRLPGSPPSQYPGYMWAGTNLIPFDFVPRNPSDPRRERRIDHWEATARRILYSNPQVSGDIKSSEYDQDFWRIADNEKRAESGTFYYIDRYDDFDHTSPQYGTLKATEYVVRRMAGPSIQYTAGLVRRPRPGMCGNSFSASLLVRPPSYRFRRSPVLRWTPCL